MKRKKIILFVSSIIVMILGLIIYLFFNQSAIISKVILSYIALPGYTGSGGLVIRVIKGYGSDLLWSISFTFIIQAIVYLRRKNIWLLLLCGGLGSIYELLQLLGIVNGTADIFDIATYFVGCALGVLIILGGKCYEEG